MDYGPPIELRLDEATTVSILPVNTEGANVRRASAGATAKRVATEFADILGPIKSVCNKFSATLRDCGPNELTVEFSAGVTAEAGVLIASAETTGSFKIVMKWKSSNEDG